LNTEQGKQRLSTRSLLEFGFEALFERSAAAWKPYQGRQSESYEKFELMSKRELPVQVLRNVF